MSRRIFFSAVIFLVLALAAWRFWPREEGGETPAARALSVRPPAIRPPDPVLAPAVETMAEKSPPPEDRIALADALNDPAGNIQSDLRVLNDIFQAWLTNFPQSGNPVGENAEITAALAGDNPLRLALISRDHRAINARGEICDRWGTPFRFHQLSGTRMEIRSAGPDRKFGTPDDAMFSP